MTEATKPILDGKTFKQEKVTKGAIRYREDGDEEGDE